MLVFGKHRKITEILACRRQLQITLDLGRVVGDVLAIGGREFMSDLDKPVWQRAKAIFNGVSLVVA
jgi:hypothetical protein